MIDWLIGWGNWLKAHVIYPQRLRRLVCRKRGHREVELGGYAWCLRCGWTEAEPPRLTVQVGCGACDVIIDIPFTFEVTEPDEDGHQHLEFDPDMTDLWAHSWAHAEEEE